MNRLRDHRLLVVAGKGGVGRTSLTAALGLASARAGASTCVVELHGQDALARRLGIHAEYGPLQVEPNLHYRGLTPTRAVGDFSIRKLGLPAVARFVVESRITTGFLEAVPGLGDIVQMGKIENMIREPLEGETAYDRVILDAPATGHGLSLIGGARAMREMTRVGPFAELARLIEDFLSDPRATGTVLATLPDVLPIHEALELAARLVEEGTPPRVAVVNQTPDAVPEAVDPAVIRRALPAGDGPASDLRRVIGHALDEASRAQDRISELREGLAPLPPIPVHTAPRLPDPDDLGPLVDAMMTLLEVA